MPLVDEQSLHLVLSALYPCNADEPRGDVCCMKSYPSTLSLRYLVPAAGYWSLEELFEVNILSWP